MDVPFKNIAIFKNIFKDNYKILHIWKVHIELFFIQFLFGEFWEVCQQISSIFFYDSRDKLKGQFPNLNVFIFDPNLMHLFLQLNEIFINGH